MKHAVKKKSASLAKSDADKEGFTFFKGCEVLVPLLLAAATFLIFSKILQHDYVSYDDGDYVYENKMVQQGLTSESVKWAFTAGHAANWHPLTWLTHMLDWHLYGNKPGKHHLTSLLIHIANTLLLFFVLLKMTSLVDSNSSENPSPRSSPHSFAAGRGSTLANGTLPAYSFWPSAFVAALFALHPVHVESVAWLAERKDVLCTFFGLLTLWSYTVYAKLVPDAANYRIKKTALYFSTLVLFACGLMSKPMLVTLPFVLLLLDYWPLGRVTSDRGQVSGEKPTSDESRITFHASRLLRLVLEKLPFFVLSAISSYVTFKVQIGKTVQSLSNFSILDRISNVLVTYVTYLWKMIWPVDLAFFYPLVKAPPFWKAGIAALFLVAVTALLIRGAKRFPYAITGWFWYLGTLVPVIGLVHVGEQSHADRYTYIPSIGIFLALVWGVAEIAEKKRIPKTALHFCAVGVLAALSLVTWKQVDHWKNSRAMLERAIAVTKQNFLAHNNYGVVLADEGKYDEAIKHYEEATRWKPLYARAYDNWGSALTLKGDLDAAVEKYEHALQLNPNEARTHHNFAVTLARQKKYDETIEQCREALRLNPKYTDAHYDLALALHLQGKSGEAIADFEKYLAARPDDGPAHFHLASALAKTKNFPKAILHFREAIKFQPNSANGYSNLAWILSANENADLRNGVEAVKLAQKAAELTDYKHLFTLGVLGAAYAEAGQFERAIETAQKAIALAEQSGRADFAQSLRHQLQFYQAGKPFRERM